MPSKSALEILQKIYDFLTIKDAQRIEHTGGQSHRFEC